MSEYKAEMINGVLEVKPIVIKKNGNVTIIVPSFPVIAKSIKEYNDGIRNI